MKLLTWLMGYADVTVEAAHAGDLLEICRLGGHTYSRFASDADGGLTLRMSLPTAKKATAELTACGIPYTVGESGGSPRIWRWCRRRPGIVVGWMMGLMLLCLSSLFVWDVRITGQEALTSADVTATLSSCGFGIGTPLHGFHADKLENRVLMADGRIAWISVNVKGTVAYVQIRETQTPTAPPLDTPTNVVATRGGTVAWVEMGEGNLLVRAGDVVKEGELLVSGLYDSYTHGYRLTHAEARIYARTSREIEVVIPLAYEKKVYENDETAILQEKSLIFFGKKIKFSKSTGNVGVLCDTIKENIPWGVLPHVGFPISTVTVTHVPYTLEPAVRTPDEAEILAYAELSRQIEAIPHVILLQKSIAPTVTDTEYRLSCTVLCIEDIARVVEIGTK